MRRLVIALDQDNFYVGVARILDPSLHNLPIGITQKSLFATVSYEARALGLRKLQSIRSAREGIAALGGTVVKQGQHGRKKDGEGVELVLVDGEDLSAYRRASAGVAWIVEGIVGAERAKGGKRKRGETESSSTTYPGPEKLGMDEVFIDVTSLIDAHLASNPPQNEMGETYFELPKSAMRVLCVPDVVPGEKMECGFWYGQELAGKVVPSNDGGSGISSRRNEGDETSAAVAPKPNASNDHTPTLDWPFPTIRTSHTPSQRLVAATHLCAFLRQIILRKTGLTSSGGVAGCKMLAKLMVSENKPAGQAVWVGGERHLDNDPRPNVNPTTHTLAATGVPEDQHDLLQTYLDPLPARSIQGFGSAVLATLATAYPALPGNPTIHDLRTTASQAAFRRLLPPSTAIPLWDLLHGRDEAPVKPSPQFPAQISVEDSSASDLWRTFSSIRMQAAKTLIKLIERMEEELTLPPGDPYADGITFHPRPISANSSWIRYPSQLRLTIRTYTSTQSKSAAMPAYVFDVSLSKQERAERIMKSLVDRMIRSLLGKGRAGTGETEYEVYVLNLAATDLHISAPPPSIGAYQQPQIDMDVLAALPVSIRAEMMHKYGISGNLPVKGEVIEVSDDDDEPCFVSERNQPGRPHEMSAKPMDGSDHCSDDHHVQVKHHAAMASKARIAAAEDTRPIKKETWCTDDVGEAQDGSDTESSTNQDSDNENDPEGPCGRCGSYVFAFAALAHARWHEQIDTDASDLVQ